jgi:ABC-type transport system involved in multi-copper enzyme maturation permease subunit
MMTMLIGRSVRRAAMIFTVLSLLLIAFQVAIIAYASSLEESQSFENLGALIPSFLPDAFGEMLMSFRGMATLGFFEPLIVMLVVQFAIYVAAEPAGDVESGIVDLVLARAVPRHRLITRSLIVMTGASVLLPLIMGIAMWASLWAFAGPAAQWPETRIVLLLMGNFAAVTWCFGGAALAVAAFAERRGSAQAVVAVAAVAFYLFEIITGIWSRFWSLGWIGPFRYFRGAAIARGTTRPEIEIPLLLAAGAVCVIVAYWQFQKRDV